MNKYRLICVLSLMLFCVQSMFAQTRITGQVLDVNQEPLIGATVTLKGARLTGVTTDLNGDFNINCQAGAMLVISYVGYTTREVKAVSGGMRIVLYENSNDIGEVVVVGTSMKKSDLTGAVSGVSEKQLEEKPVTNINQALQGKVAGVFISQPTRPTDDSQIRVRGVNTINSGSSPIYVVDGMVMDNSFSGFNSINLNDVASIEVMKDASATALYGSRAANGVIVITTKKGQKGEGRVTYDGWIGIESYAHMPKTMNTKQTFELRELAYQNGYAQAYPNGNPSDPLNSTLDLYTKNTILSGNAVFADYEFDAYKNNTTSDWLGAVTRTGVVQNHQLSFSNAFDKGSYYLSFGYTNNNGVIKNSGQDKYFGRINADMLIKPWLKVGTNTAFTRTNDDLVDDYVMDHARGANPMLAVDDTRPVLNWQGNEQSDNFNPIRSLQIQHRRAYNQLTSVNYINVNPIKGLNFRTSLAINYAQKQENKYTPNDIQEAIRYSTHGEAIDNRDTQTMWQWDNTITYDTTFGLNRINALLGTSATQTNYSYINGNAHGFITNYFGYKNLGAGYMSDLYGLGSAWTKSSLMSYIARVNYTYADRYNVTGTLRYDGSSKFAPGHQWGLFPSISAAWNITEESFMKRQNVFNQLKLRVGFGSVGNQDTRLRDGSTFDFGYYSLYNVSHQASGQIGSADYTTSFVSNGIRGNEDVTWEKQQQWNIGLDMAFWNSRIRASIDAYLINNNNLLLARALPTTSGFSQTVENVGTLQNKGIDFSVSADLIRTPDFTWDVSATLSMNKEKITKLFANTNKMLNVDQDNHTQNEGNFFVGEAVHNLYMYKTGGIAQESDMERLNKINWNGRQVNPGDLYPQDMNGDNAITEADRVIVGCTDPKAYGGFSTDLSYKGLSLNAIFTYSIGAKKIAPWYNTLITSIGTGVASSDLENNTWTPDNTNALFPRVIATQYGYSRFNANEMDFCVQNASYLRLSALTLAYTFNNKVQHALHLSNLRVYATASNLFCVTGYKGYDPETGDWYPPTRMWTFGVNIAF